MNRGQSLGRTGEFRFFTLTVNKPLKYIKPIVTAELVTYTLCGFFLIKAQFNANNLFNHPLRYHK